MQKTIQKWQRSGTDSLFITEERHRTLPRQLCVWVRDAGGCSSYRVNACFFLNFETRIPLFYACFSHVVVCVCIVKCGMPREIIVNRFRNNRVSGQMDRQ